ncbi:MAG: NAD-dependent epimerase/dehydratase family protein [Bacteroidales bacterium]|jgi:nucleoside-diphosphate-sugar epimerase|nr:NAD-dependent epimerase/dehydratase family protein [Bacteroidales bacterium]
MKLLFIGGTGIISSACSALALAREHELFVLNRGTSAHKRPLHGAHELRADIRNAHETAQAIAPHSFDCVVDFISFTPEHVEQNMALFAKKTKQYIFISSASAYQTPPLHLPITERTPLENPFWEYSRHKIACEDMLIDAWNNSGFPATIVRPSHTYDKTLIPIEGGYTVLHRMIHNQPIVIHGDGTSLWTLTHHSDFAKGLLGVCGNEQAIGEAFHITSDEYLSWNRIYELFGSALGVTPQVVYVPSTVIAAYNTRIGDSLLGDKAHSMIFDNAKIKSFVPDFKCSIPFEQGVHEIVQWHAKNPQYQTIDNEINELFNTLVHTYTHTTSCSC